MLAAQGCRSKWDKAVLMVDLGTGEQPWLKEVHMGELAVAWL